MGFKFEVKGLDDIQKTLKELEKSIDPNTFNEWADRIGRTTKQICNDPDCQRIKIIKTGQGRVNFEIADKEAADCVIQSIQQQLNSMPPPQQELFKGIMTELETRKKQF